MGVDDTPEQDGAFELSHDRRRFLLGPGILAGVGLASYVTTGSGSAAESTSGTTDEETEESDSEPEAWVSISDQMTDGSYLTVDSAYYSEGEYIIVVSDSRGVLLGWTDPIDADEPIEDVTLQFDHRELTVGYNTIQLGRENDFEEDHEVSARLVHPDDDGGRGLSIEVDGERVYEREITITVRGGPEPVEIPFGLNVGGEPDDSHSDLPVVIDGLEFVPVDSLRKGSGNPTARNRANFVDFDDLTIFGNSSPGGFPNTRPDRQRFSAPGTAFETDVPIDGTDHDALYQTEFYGNGVGFYIPVPDGTYDVRLHFAELHHDESGARLVDISVGGDLIHHRLDIYDEVGANAALTTLVEDVEVTDGTIRIITMDRQDFSTFAGIEIREAGHQWEEYEEESEQEEGESGDGEQEEGEEEDDREEPTVDVETSEDVDAEPSTVEVRGEVLALTEGHEADVSFEFGSVYGGLDQSVSAGTVEEPGPFTATISDLIPGSMYNYRAIADVDGERDVGETERFRAR